MSATICAWQDDCFQGVSDLFDELWGWELEGSDAEKRDIADLYIAETLLACNRLRVIKEAGTVAAFLGAVFYENPPEGEGLENPQAMRCAALAFESRLKQTAYGRASIAFNDQITAANRQLKADMLGAGLAWGAELKLLMTSSRFQGRGLARSLIDDAFEDMRRRGIDSAILYTDTHCSWRYYEKTGWRLAASRVWSHEGDPIRAFAYHKHIQPV